MRKSTTLWSNSFLSNWLFAWCWPLVMQVRKAPISALRFVLRTQESARFNGARLQTVWLDELSKKGNDSKATVARSLIRSFGTEYALIGLYKIAWAAFTWLCAFYFLQQTLIFIQNKEDYFVGHMYAMSLFISAILSSVFIHQLYGECARVGIKVKAALSVLIYRKSLRLSRVRGGAGEVINILSTDLTRVNDLVANFHFLWSAFLETALIIILSFITIGNSTLPALGFVLILTPIQMYLGKLTSDLNRDQTSLTTERVHLMSEILTAIKLIKFYAWEKPFSQKISEIREKELNRILRGMIIKAINFMVVFAIPVWTALTCLGMYVGLNGGKALTASISFTVLSLFNTLRYPFFMLPMAVRSYAGAITAFERLDKFMHSEEVEEVHPEPAPENSDLVFEIKNADFKWDGADSDKPTLQDITLVGRRGMKIAVIGDVGAGKSSLIAALLGQIRQVNGEKMKLYGNVSYSPQQAWLLNETLRENILFGSSMNRRRYKEVIRVCSLQRDLSLLLAGDQTELAERGANLSGGQRQRTSLARAVYHDSDLVLLDDPISAVDQHVGRHIFEECFLKFLKDKTCVISLHQLQYLPQMDWVVVMKNGRITMQGTYDQLMNESEDFSSLINNHVASGEQGEQDDEPEVVNDANFELPDEKPKSDFLTVEKQGLTVRSWKEISSQQMSSIIERNQHTITKGGAGHDIAEIIRKNELSVYSVSDMPAEDEDYDDAGYAQKGKLTIEDTSGARTGKNDFFLYFNSATGWLVTSAVVFLFAFAHGIRIGSDYWLRLWIPVAGREDTFYISVYTGFTIAFAVFVLLRGLAFAYIGYYKSIALHNKVFNSVLYAPMSFFDSTPLGRILSVFSKHLLHVDDTMPDAFMQFLQYFPIGLGALLLCAILIPYNYIPSILIVLIGALFVKFSNPAIDKTKGLDAMTKAPVFAHTSTSLEGLFSIRAYHAQDRFDQMNIDKIDRNHEASFALSSVKSFQALYLDVLSSLVVYFSALLVVMNRDAKDMGAVAGLALSNALQMLVFVQWTVRMWGEVNSQMSSVGQIVHYSDIPSEAPAEIEETKPPKSWPAQGRIDFENIRLRYSKFGVDVLKDINFTIHPREKIGIVGRTGSGKSTLLISLLRIVEAAEGKITIDGVDVSKIGLADLRSKIAIIPQEPVLFVGTVRSNLDPFNRSDDEQIWKALDAVNLGEVIRAMPGKLDSAVIENGNNFSLGQRQCFCIARAILAKTKVLVLDEATAAIDMATDLLIQNAIKTAFADLTVLTIAHRLNTIIESDRVLVMDAGKILEFDEPIKLLNDPNGSFRNLVDQTGEATAQKLTEMAILASEERKKLPTVETLTDLSS